jgi:hypothetical protein
VQPVDQLDEGRRWAAAERLANATREIEYRVGAQSVQVRAMPDSYDAERDLVEAGIARTAEICDWKINRADLVIAGQPVTPAIGHVIVDVVDGIERRWEVNAVIPGEKCWKWCDVSFVTMRIHTLEVAT